MALCIRDLPRFQELAETSFLKLRQNSRCCDVEGAFHRRIQMVLPDVFLKIHVRVKCTATHPFPIDDHPPGFMGFPLFGCEEISSREDPAIKGLQPTDVAGDHRLLEFRFHASARTDSSSSRS